MGVLISSEVEEFTVACVDQAQNVVNLLVDVRANKINKDRAVALLDNYIMTLALRMSVSSKASDILMPLMLLCQETREAMRMS